MNRIAFAFLALFSAPALLAPQDLDTRYIDFVAGEGLRLGVGYDPTKFTVKPVICIDFQSPPALPDNVAAAGSGQSVESTLEEISRSSDIANRLGIDVSHTVGGGMGIFAGSMSAHLVNDLTISTHSQTYVARAKIASGQDVVLENPTLKSGSAERIKKNYHDFRGRCGDYYVHGFASGGEYLGTVTIETRSLEDKLDVRAAFSAKLKAGIGKGSTSVEVDNHFQAALQDREVTVKEFRKGGRGQVLATNIDQMLSNFRDFASDVNNASFYYKVILVPYVNLLDDSDVSTADITEVSQSLEDLGERYQDYRIVSNDLVYILDNPREFVDPDTTRIQLWQKEVAGNLKQISDAMKTCGDGVNACRAAVTDLSAKTAADDYIKGYPKRVSGSIINAWREVGGILAQVSVGSEDQVWGVNPGDAVFRRDRTANSWVGMPGFLVSVSAAADGTVWGVNRDGVVFSWDGISWNGVDGLLLNQIAVGNKDQVWGVTSSGDVFQRSGASWDKKPGRLAVVSVGRDGTVWGIGGDGPRASRNEVYRWNGSDWDKVPGALTHVSVGNKDRVWGMSANGQVVRWTGSGWEVFDFPLTRISVAADGTMWGLNGQGLVFRWTASVID